MKLLTFFKGKLVGHDPHGNKYYQERFFLKQSIAKPRRWVMYCGVLEASQVPPEWFGWIHHLLDAPLDDRLKKEWQKSYQPNRTGTSLAYRPPGHILKEGALQPTSRSYEPWKPL